MADLMLWFAKIINKLNLGADFPTNEGMLNYLVEEEKKRIAEGKDQ